MLFQKFSVQPLESFVSLTLLQNCGFYFFNPFFKAIGISYAFLFKEMNSTFKRKFSVPFLYDFHVHILDRRSGSASLLNGLRLFSIIDFISFTAKLSLCLKLSDFR